MNSLPLLAGACALYWAGYRLYAPRVARALGEDDARPTPAVTVNDGVDYVPTRPHVLFAHHFSAISAAGPILGPTWAVLYGYVPAVLWIVLGGIAIGAVHDYACLFVSMREGGRSIAEIARMTLGTPAYVLYCLFIVFNLVVVNAVFINITAVSLTSEQPPAALGLADDQTIFRTVERDGRKMAQVGGIASTSAIAITAVAPLIGWLFIRRGVRERYTYPLASVLCLLSVIAGFAWPVSLATTTWIVVLSLYVWFAAAVPVWMILQPREFVSVQFLYLGILLMVSGLVGSGLRGVELSAPPADLAAGAGALGMLWPTLFVTIACGAVSGFHGLVGSGTTSKFVARESHARHVGYGAMLGESLLALCVTLAVASGMSHEQYTSLLVKPAAAPADWRANPVLAFSLGVAGVCEQGLGIPRWLGLLFGLLMVEGFVLDTLDVSIRLNRYLLEEIWTVVIGKPPRLAASFWFNSGLAVAMMLALALSGTAESLWPIFGTGNQLLASLSLVAVSLWLVARGRRSAFVLVPAILVGSTTLASLVYLLGWRYLPGGKVLLAVVDVLFLALSAGVLAFALRAARALAARA
jgi:carbon starvation protein